MFLFSLKVISENFICNSFVLSCFNNICYIRKMKYDNIGLGININNILSFRSSKVKPTNCVEHIAKF